MASMISSKGRYALAVMADLATHEGWVSLGDVAERQGISRKYLEQVTSSLLKAGLVESQRGKSGGYRLVRQPAEYSLGEILRTTEGTLAPVSCLDCTIGELCPRAEGCATMPVWRELREVTSSFLNSKSLADIVGEGEGELAI